MTSRSLSFLHQREFMKGGGEGKLLIFGTESKIPLKPEHILRGFHFSFSFHFYFN